MSDDGRIKEILEEYRTIAVVGCSRDLDKDAYRVPKYLKEHGYRVIPINPFAEELLGEKSYKTLSEVKEPVEIVEVFRPSSEALKIVEEAVRLKPKPKAIWMQLGIEDKKAAELARDDCCDEQVHEGGAPETNYLKSAHRFHQQSFWQTLQSASSQ